MYKLCTFPHKFRPVYLQSGLTICTPFLAAIRRASSAFHSQFAYVDCRCQSFESQVACCKLPGIWLQMWPVLCCWSAMLARSLAKLCRYLCHFWQTPPPPTSFTATDDDPSSMINSMHLELSSQSVYQGVCQLAC